MAMFFVSRDKKIAIIFVTLMTLTSLKVWLASALDLIIISFIISEYKNLKAFFIQINRNKITKKILFLLILMFVLDIIFSPHLHSTIEIIKYFDLFIFRKYLLLFITFYTIKVTNNTKPLIKYSIIAMGVLTFFGIINYIQKESDIVSAFVSVNNKVNFAKGDAFSFSNRFRVQSMFINPFDYGYICCICLLIYLNKRKQFGNRLFIAMIFCCIFGILLCGCRTVIICALTSVLIYFCIVYNTRRFVLLTLLMLTISVLSYILFPFVTEKIDSVVKLFSDEDYGGSSLSMRQVQFATVLKYVEYKPLFGNGVGYFYEDLGWENGDQSRIDSDLQGLEGIYLGRILEHGFVGYILYIIVWIIMLLSLIKCRKNNRTLAGLGIAVWTAYTCFANMTGELLSVAPTLIIIGCIMGHFSSKHVGTPAISIRN